MDPADAADAKHHMDGYLLLGRELTVVFAEENRKKPTEMRARERGGGRCMNLSLFELFWLLSNIKNSIFNIFFWFVGAADFGIEDVLHLVTTLALVLLPLDVVDLGHGAVTIILLPLEDITQDLSRPGKSDMMGGGHTRAHLPLMAQGVAV
jgi:hypothetical protein